MNLAESVAQFREITPREHPSCSSPKGHNFVMPHAGIYRCRECGYHYERHGTPGFPENGLWPCYYVDRVYAMPGRDE
jgi:hypothetical protein